MDVAAALTPHLECPICLQVPRDGIMLTCLNGHNVCNSCKNKLCKDVKCPQCRCDFATPPARNATVTDLVERFPFEWPCKFHYEVGCAFEGTRASLASHEVACRQRRLIPCPHHECTETVSLGVVSEHLASTHKISVADVSDSDKDKHWFKWKEANISRSEDFSWTEVALSLDGGEFALLCAQWHKGAIHVWLWANLDAEEAEKVVCSFSVCLDNGNLLGFPHVPVYPMVWNRREVLQDDRCFHICNSLLSLMLTDEEVSEKDRNEGYSRFAVKFRMLRKSDLLGFLPPRHGPTTRGPPPSYIN